VRNADRALAGRGSCPSPTSPVLADRGLGRGRGLGLGLGRAEADMALADRGRADLALADMALADRGRADLALVELALADRARADRGPGRGLADRARADRGPGRGLADRGLADRALAERGPGRRLSISHTRRRELSIEATRRWAARQMRPAGSARMIMVHRLRRHREGSAGTMARLPVARRLTGKARRLQVAGTARRLPVGGTARGTARRGI
jgi:hypothetical protein